ncbi:uncharacterized protein LOC105689999 [Athalia rosae]|uniref:uncharacterized protein LOC105689999 n=1 Tax=Athalia rosae TaxID=37344 RepID=UPI002033BB86|nr:uncharacterized protein LOC105689999 [Athalia rosae]
MGCAPSGISGKGSLRLMATKITFSKEQLDTLNVHFSKSLANSIQENADTKAIEATVERLVQRLLIGAGNIDSRFSSMFLISLNDRTRIKQLKFEYLIRLDALSSPGLTSEQIAPVCVEEDASMPGFARVNIRGTGAESWGEFLGPGGRLRRDLIKAKIANLLAAATKPGSTNGADERLCWTPGQVVDPEVLDKILKQPDHCRVFYGPAYSDAILPEPRDHRVALVEDATGILLRIGLSGSKNREAEVRLLIGVAVPSWSILADYPRRIPLHHCDALLHLTAAQTGMYVVAVGPYPGARCEDRATLWRVRFPAAESVMQHHYHEDSVPASTTVVLWDILDQLRKRRPLKVPLKNKDMLRVVSRHTLKTIHWWSLERAGPDPLRSWAPGTLSRHVLTILDELVTSLKCQSLRCYFYPRCNVMLQCAKGGILHHEDSYLSDSKLLESYLVALHQNSLNDTPVEMEPSDILENELIARWNRVITSLPRGTMGRHCGYGGKQLEYLSLVVREVLKVKKVIHKGGDDDIFQNLSNFENVNCSLSEPTENLIHLLTLTLRQARDQIYAATDRRHRKETRRKILGRKSNNAATTYFENSVDVLVDIVRRDRETAYLDLENHTVLAKTLVKWLYFGMEHDKKTLGPILRPYLGNLFNSSHENAWHVESWRKRDEIFNTEMRSLSLFCKLVTTQEISPANGVVDSFSKGWTWAENVTKMIERSENGLRLVFLSDKVARYNLTFANNKGLNMYSTWSKARNVSNAVKRTTLARTNMITMSNLLPNADPGENRVQELAGHVVLREMSPLTSVVSMGRRRGRQRGPGGLVPALVALNKFRVLQEVAAVLPHDERIAMLDAVQRVAREASRRSRRASCPDPSTSGSPRQTYTPRSESHLDLLPNPPLSPTTRQRSIIAEHQRQLHREMLEMHDTMTRGLRPRGHLPSWDSASLASWSSSVGSVGRNRLRISRPSTWDSVRGPSPIWDSVSTDGSFVKTRSEEMISREDSPKWNTLERGSCLGGFQGVTNFVEQARLPSWESLEATLDEKLSKYEPFPVEPDSLEIQENRDVGIDYLLTANPSREIPRENNRADQRRNDKIQRKITPLKRNDDAPLKLTLEKDVAAAIDPTKKGRDKKNTAKMHRDNSR